MSSNLLHLEVFTHTIVPHVASVHGALIPDTNMRVLAKVLAAQEVALLVLALLVERCSPLRIKG